MDTVGTTDLPSGYGCSEECGCEHCLRLIEALEAYAARLSRIVEIVDVGIEGNDVTEDLAEIKRLAKTGPLGSDRRPNLG